MLYQKNKPGWIALLAPVGWLACRIIERVFKDKWHVNKEIPYDKNAGPDEE